MHGTFLVYFILLTFNLNASAIISKIKESLRFVNRLIRLGCAFGTSARIKGQKIVKKYTHPLVTFLIKKQIEPCSAKAADCQQKVVNLILNKKNLDK